MVQQTGLYFVPEIPISGTEFCVLIFGSINTGKTVAGSANQDIGTENSTYKLSTTLDEILKGSEDNRLSNAYPFSIMKTGIRLESTIEIS